MSNTISKRIALIVRRVHSGNLLDCPLFAIKPPLHPKSSRCPFSECMYTRHFPKHALLDLPRRLKPRGKVHQNRRNSRHFPRRWKRQVRREMAVEPMPQQATGESAPKSQKFPALSPEVETAGAAREACGAGAQQATGESVPKSQEIPALSPEGDTCS